MKRLQKVSIVTNLPHKAVLEGSFPLFIIIFGLVLVASAFGGTIQNLVPVFFPLFAPCEGAFADGAYFLRQIVFVDHFHGLTIGKFKALAHP